MKKILSREENREYQRKWRNANRDKVRGYSTASRNKILASQDKPLKKPRSQKAIQRELRQSKYIREHMASLAEVQAILMDRFGVRDFNGDVVIQRQRVHRIKPGWRRKVNGLYSFELQLPDLLGAFKIPTT